MTDEKEPLPPGQYTVTRLESGDLEISDGPFKGHRFIDILRSKVAADDTEEKYPEHVKLRAISASSQMLCEFVLERLPARSYRVCRWHEDIGDYRTTSDGTIIDLVAEYFGIDQKKLDAEKEQMLAEMRERAAKAPHYE